MTGPGFYLRLARALAAMTAFASGTSTFHSASALTVETVPIGDPGNSPDDTGFGSVNYAFRMGRTEVTIAQYAEFLNAVAAADPFNLYNVGMGTFDAGGIVRGGEPDNYTYMVKPPAVGKGPGGSDYAFATKPITSITWFDAARFANWVNNGQGTGDTETGAYTLLGGTPIPSNANSVLRNPGAKWFLPSRDEWYKAAYFDPHKPGGPGYYNYPMGSDAVPDNHLPTTDTGNSANFRVAGIGQTTGSNAYPFTDVGAYTLSASPYGTSDQGGNLYEFHDTFVGVEFKGLMGGFYALDAVGLRASGGGSENLANERSFFGIRLAAIEVPEPTTGMLTALIATSVTVLLGPRLRTAGNVSA